MVKWKDRYKIRSSLEQAIAYLANRCDGASSDDSQGFNGFDASYGHWLADRITDGKPLLRKWAASAYKMLIKYKGQLERGGIILPPWEAIADKYPEKYLPLERATPSEEYRIIIHGKHLAAFSPYDPSGLLNEAYKSVHGWIWNKVVEKAWTFPIAEGKNLINALLKAECLDRFAIGPEIHQLVSDIEQAEFDKVMAGAELIMELIDAADLDGILPNGRSLFPHQKEAVQWLVSHRDGGLYKGGILADDMGLGKTMSALVAAKAMVKVHNCPVLVICPASLKDNWIREAEGVGVAIEVFSWAKVPPPIEQQKFVLIADEAHMAQEMKSSRTKALLELSDSSNCLAVWLLTGTPIKNGRPKNLFPLLVVATCNSNQSGLQSSQF